MFNLITLTVAFTFTDSKQDDQRGCFPAAVADPV